MNGFYNRVLFIDITLKRFEIQNLEDFVLRSFLGGKGLASHLLLTYNPPGVHPLDPDNCLIFATGPVTGSPILGSCRYGLYTKSPQTGFYAESYSGGRTPESIDAVGFDAILIRGKSMGLIILKITPDGVTFHNASSLKGKNTYSTEDKVMEQFGIQKKGLKYGAVVIGPAGENCVSFAVVGNDYWRSAGRTGTGAVMGSKGIKAILFMGDRKRTYHDKTALKALSENIARDAKDNPAAQAYRQKGTPMMVEILNNAGAFPTRYWAEGTFEKWRNISAEALHDRCDVSPHACLKCVLACGRLSTVKEGRHKGLKIEGPEYETIYAFGGLCCIDSIEEILFLNDICDRLGMDTISAGNLCAFTIEAVKRKKISDNINYGDVDAIAELLHKIAFRKGIGDVLAKGINFASKEWGLEEIAVHVKGLEPAGYDPRVLKGMGLGYATSDRGACHLRATFYKPELSGIIAPETIQGKAELFIDFEDRLTLFDSLILCRFYRELYSWERLGEMIHALTELSPDKASLKKISFSISDEVRRFNIREGLSREDDRLPSRFHREFLAPGHMITEEELKSMIDDYYRIRGWDREGRPATLWRGDTSA